jgi:hypothetical protein
MAPDPAKDPTKDKDKNDKSGSVGHACGALREASREWAGQNRPLLEAGRATQGVLALSGTEMGYALPLHATYQDISNGIHDLLTEAAAEMDKLADALMNAADAYQKDEEDGTHKLKGLW